MENKFNHIPEKYLIALKAALLASNEIMKFYEASFQTEIKNDGSPVTEADLASSNIIVEQLQSTQIPIVCEETENSDFEKRKQWSECWCVDPLDGTKEFIKKNGEFSINIAYIKNQEAVFGLIASPVNDLVIFGAKEIGVFTCQLSQYMNFSKWTTILAPTKMNEPPVLTFSRSHQSENEFEFIEFVKTKFTSFNTWNMGSAWKFYHLAKGEVDAYARYTPTMEWDIAAGHAILDALGGKVLQIESQTSLIYNKENLRNPYFIATTKAFAECS